MSEICTHEEFLNELNAAPQDVSLPVFEDLIGQGYVEGQWQTSPSATDNVCIALGGERFALADLISNLMHAAPVYEKSHVGCHCVITCNGPDLPDVTVGAFGIV